MENSITNTFKTKTHVLLTRTTHCTWRHLYVKIQTVKTEAELGIDLAYNNYFDLTNNVNIQYKFQK